MPHITASLNNLKPSLNRIGKIFAQESPLYSKHLGVAGRVDCVGEFDGVPSIIDFKTSKKIKKKEKSNLSQVKRLGLVDKHGRPL